MMISENYMGDRCYESCKYDNSFNYFNIIIFDIK